MSAENSNKVLMSWAGVPDFISTVLALRTQGNACANAVDDPIELRAARLLEHLGGGYSSSTLFRYAKHADCTNIQIVSVAIQLYGAENVMYAYATRPGEMHEILVRRNGHCMVWDPIGDDRHGDRLLRWAIANDLPVKEIISRNGHQSKYRIRTMLLCEAAKRVDITKHAPGHG